MPETREVIIAGSGPAGYTAAIYAARAGLAPLVLMGKEDAGGALMTTTDVDNFPGFSGGIEGPVLMEEMRAQAERFGAELIVDEATNFHLDGAIKSVTDSQGEAHHARSIILAMGSSYRKLGLSKEDQLSGRGVSWCATCDGYPYQDRPVLVVGGGDSALEEASFLHRLGAQVRIVHRRDEFRGSKILRDQVLAGPGAATIWNSEVIELRGNDNLSGVVIRDVLTDEIEELAVDGLFIAIGHEPRSNALAGQIRLDEDGYVVVDYPTTRTSVDGVFACGDLVDRTYRQAVVAAGTGCAAALDAERYLAALDGREVKSEPADVLAG